MGTQGRVRDASVWHDGSGVPSASLGEDGDLYNDLDNGKKYKKVAGVWIWGGGVGHIIQDESVELTGRTSMNFVGFGVEDDAGNDATVITAPTNMTGAVDVLNGADAAAFTPSFASDWANVTWTGQQWRVGNMLFMEIEGSVTSTPTGTDLVLSLPNSLSVDSTILDNIAMDNQVIGHISFLDSGAIKTYLGKASASAATQLTFKADGGSLATYTRTVNASPTVPFTLATGDTITARIGVPISSWEVTKRLNIGAIPALFMCKVSATAATVTTGADTDVVFTSEDRDDNNMFTIGTDPSKVYIPAGCDSVSVFGSLVSNWASAATFTGIIEVDGTSVAEVTSGHALPKLAPTYSGDIVAGSYVTLAYHTINASQVSGHMTVIAWNSQANATAQHTFLVGLGYETVDAEVATAAITFRMPHAFNLTEVRASATTAPTGADAIIDVKMDGVSIFSTLLHIDSGSKTSVGSATPAVITTSALTDDAEITIDITQIGSSVAGAGFKVALIGY